MILKKTRNIAHPLSRGGTTRLKKRSRMHTENKGKISRPPIKKRKMYNRKTSKKVDRATMQNALEARSPFLN